MRILILALALAGCAVTSGLPQYPKIVQTDGYLVECGKPYTAAERKAGVKHDCTYYGNSRARVFRNLGEPE